MTNKPSTKRNEEVLMVLPLPGSKLLFFKELLARYGYLFKEVPDPKDISQAIKKSSPKLALVEISLEKPNENLKEIIKEIRKSSSVMKIVGVFFGKLVYNVESLYANGLDFVHQLPFEAEIITNTIFEYAPIEISDEELTIETVSRVNVLELEWSEALPFDIFIVLPHNRKIILYRKKGERLDQRAVEKFRGRSHYSLYIKKSDLSVYYNYSAQVLSRLQKDGNLSKIEKEKKLAGEVRKLLSGFFAQENKDESQGQIMLESARKVLGQLEDSSGSKKQLANVIRELASQNLTSYTHCRNVATYCALFGLAMGFSEPETLQMGGFLHDLGMGDLPSNLIGKDYADMTEEEKAQYKLHPGHGTMTLKFKKMNLPEAVIKMIMQHHEKNDGSGFPYGLKGDEIHPYAKICALADEFDELTSLRMGKQTHTPSQAMRKIAGLDGGKRSDYFEEKFFGNMVKNFLTDMGDKLSERDLDKLAGPIEIPPDIEEAPPEPVASPVVVSAAPPIAEVKVQEAPVVGPAEVKVKEDIKASGSVKVVSSKDTISQLPADITPKPAAKVPIFEAETVSIVNAIKKANLDDVKKFIEGKGNVNAPDEAGLTPLNYALRSGNRDIAKLILKAKANLNLQDPNGNTPIMQAIESNNYEMFNLVLVAAFEAGNINANKKTSLSATGKTWLSSALNINIKNNKGETALMVAARVGNDQMLEALIDAGADVNVKNSKGESVLQVAQAYKRNDMVSILTKLEKSAVTEKPAKSVKDKAEGNPNPEKATIDIYTRNSSGQIPLAQACVKGDEATVIKLIEAKSELNSRDMAGQTPIMLAARQGSIKNVRALLEKGANPQLKDGQGRGPLLHSIEGGHPEVIKVLVQAGCAIDTRHLGATPLMIACFTGNLDVVKALIECGANPLDKDARGKNAADYAKSKTHHKIVDYLAELGKKKSA